LNANGACGRPNFGRSLPQFRDAGGSQSGIHDNFARTGEDTHERP
jgi:hypothetical protein